MKTYPIQQWNSIIANNNPPVPTIYIQYDKDINTLYKCNNGLVSIRVMDTSESCYENKIYYGVITPSKMTGGYRPNFQAQTGLWGIMIYTRWNGYPRENGYVQILNPIPESPNNLNGSDLPIFQTITSTWFKIEYMYILMILLVLILILFKNNIF